MPGWHPGSSIQAVMQKFTTKIVNMMKAGRLFETQGGLIILSQYVFCLILELTHESQEYSWVEIDERVQRKVRRLGLQYPIMGQFIDQSTTQKSGWMLVR